ncbi:hypothetical protein V6N13_100370 [Hibiscus sabdariffa]|uniref:Uncharacterized protein n=2 Tax=Hibiscus sabdariffa TaxID=183260 RepID=A0ABR2PCE6_9ROSI
MPHPLSTTHYASIEPAQLIHPITASTHHNPEPEPYPSQNHTVIYNQLIPIMPHQNVAPSSGVGVSSPLLVSTTSSQLQYTYGEIIESNSHTQTL